MYSLTSLCETCCEFMDRNAAEIIQSDALLTLSGVSTPSHLIFNVIFEQALSRTSFRCIRALCYLVILFVLQSSAVT